MLKWGVDGQTAAMKEQLEKETQQRQEVEEGFR